MADGDERALVARIAAGDRDALRILYTRYHPRLWRYLWRRLDGNAGAVEDVLQETWLAVWRAAPGYQPRGQVAAWIYRIAHHQAAHIRRDHARRPEGHLQSGAFEASDDEPCASEPSVFSEQRILDRQALGRHKHLPARVSSCARTGIEPAQAGFVAVGV
jgi:RNA polymerase sigma factor (sigma-70 family)